MILFYQYTGGLPPLSMAPHKIISIPFASHLSFRFMLLSPYCYSVLHAEYDFQNVTLELYK